jgi:phage shock protein A
VLDRFVKTTKAFASGFFNEILGKGENPQMMLDQALNDLNSSIAQLKQALDKGIVIEKQLEKVLQKNRDKADNWQNRAAMAVQQNNEMLARQALQNKQQYVQASIDLEKQLKLQKEATSWVRQRLSELEKESAFEC